MPPKPTAPIREQALHWLTRLHSGECAAAERQAFERWLAEDEAHWREFGRARRLWADLGEFAALDFPERQAARRYRAEPEQPARWLARLSACLTLLASLPLMWSANWSAAHTEHYHTALGEYRRIQLADGSEVELNTDSELDVVWLAGERLLSLRRGEALFHAAHDERRPFDVYAGGARIRAVGTRFDVYLQAGQVQVLVEEGIVGVTDGTAASQRLRRGQMQRYANGHWSLPENADAEAALAWRQGKLIFKSLPLREVLAQARRYQALEIRLADASLGGLKLSGVFETGQWQTLVSSLENTLDLHAQTLAPGKILLGRAGRKKP